MNIILGPIIGAVTDRSAKIWIYWNKTKKISIDPECAIFLDKNCEKFITKIPFKRVSPSIHKVGGINGIASVANVDIPKSEKEIFYKIIFDGDPVKETYHCKTFPQINSPIENFSFGLISCHQITSPPNAENNMTSKMWKYLNNKLSENHCSFLIQAGDQVYADKLPYNAWEFCLKESKSQRRIWHYRQLYLTSWNNRQLKKVISTFPQYMVWDDHEITNGWGSEPKHYSDSKYFDTFKAARRVYNEFQHSHNPSSLRKGEYYYTFNYGPAAFLVLDLRGNRNISKFDKTGNKSSFPLGGNNQWKDIVDWLNTDVIKKSKLLFIVSSVPVFHLSRKFGSLGKYKNDINDQWSTPHNKEERRLLLRELYKWKDSEQKSVFILGGDVHVGTVAIIKKNDDQKVIYQITSSPITNKPAYYLDFLLALISKKFQFKIDSKNNIQVIGRIIKRYRRRNFAIISADFSKIKPQVTLNMYRQGKTTPNYIQFVNK